MVQQSYIGFWDEFKPQPFWTMTSLESHFPLMVGEIPICMLADEQFQLISLYPDGNVTQRLGGNWPIMGTHPF